MKRKWYMNALIALFMIALVLAGCGQGTAGKSGQNANTEQSAGAGNKQDAGENGQNSQDGQIQMVDKLQITVGGASPGGFWSLLGNGIGNLIIGTLPDSQYSYETGNGVRNIIDVSEGKLDAGIAFNFEVTTAMAGGEPFPKKVDNVVALMSLYNNSPVQIIISKDFSEKYGITSMEDIAEKKPPIRVGVNQKGNLSEAVNRAIFEAYGITYEDIESWGGKVFYEPYKPSADLMKDNRLDWIGVPVFAPDGTFIELSSTKDIMLLSLNENALKLLQDRFGLKPGVIKANTYEWQTEDVMTVNAGAFLLANPDMPNDVAYTITKIIIENFDKYKALHKNLEPLTPDQMLDVSPAKLHPGAEKFFKEYLKMQ